MDEMNDSELKDLLKEWEMPETPSSLKTNVINKYRKQQKWHWRRLLTGSLQVPVPVASLAILIMAGLAIAVYMLKFQSPQITANVAEAPGIEESVVNREISREQPILREQTIPASYEGINLQEFQPVASLVPRIIRRGKNVDQN